MIKDNRKKRILVKRKNGAKKELEFPPTNGRVKNEVTCYEATLANFYR